MTMHDRTTPIVGGALTAPANLRAICAARAAALEQIGRAAQALRAAFDLSTAATATAKAAIMGALNLYLDFINMFVMMLQLFGNRE